MKRTIQNFPVVVKCMLLGVFFQCLISGAVKAADHIISIEERNLSANFTDKHPETTPVKKGSKSRSNEKEVLSQQSIEVKGRVISKEDNEGLPGINVIIKGTRTGTVTDIDGNFSIKVPSPETVLVFSSIGFKTKEVLVGSQTVINISMDPEVGSLDEVVIIGYGEQKKESVIAAITQTNREVLERAGGVQSIAAALTGNLPGVITLASTGMPGEEDPRILIRGASTWNNTNPLILVDGIERPMESVDISSVETISVLKDASATAVYGVRGANGVILITTKRGKDGKAQIRARVNTTIKSPSRLPGKYDSYDSYLIRNQAIENELSLRPESWANYMPYDLVRRYRYPANLEEQERYPNVDWQDALFRRHAMAYNASLNISGGTKLVKYFTSADFMQENDLFRQYDNNRSYQAGYTFNRLNVRSNLDFTLSPTTVLKSNLAGSYGVQQKPMHRAHEFYMWSSVYAAAPDVYLPKYSDGTWGYFAPDPNRASNSVRNLALSGVEYITTTRINTDFVLDQDLKMIAKGLKFQGILAFDNTFVEGNRGINDANNPTQEKWIDPETGNEIYRQVFDAASRFDFMERKAWTTVPGSVNNWQLNRRLFYQGQISYATTIADKHNITAMGLFNRNEYATGSEIPRFREDWVFRSTYNWDNKYMVEYNGAYTGSEKFSPEHRFAFFQSGGLGWMISRENFMKDISFLEYLKIRANYGEIGDDNIHPDHGRWLFMTNWAYGGNSRMGVFGWQGENSPYTWYREQTVGNPNVHWEKVAKANIGIEFEILKGFLGGTVDFFRDDRTNILIPGNDRAIPAYYGARAPVANLGRVQNRGFEFQLNVNRTIRNVRLWSNLMMTHAKNRVLFADDPQLLPDYQKREGFQMHQARTHVGHSFYNNWDELYASTTHNQRDLNKLPGGYHILDYNGDGVIDQYDVVPFGFAGNPQNTYNATIGFEWKGLSAFVQFYGVNNVTRQVVFSSLNQGNMAVFHEGTYWSKDNVDADGPMPRWTSLPADYWRGNQYFFDASYIRLKNAEVGYTFNSDYIRKMGLNNIRLFVNGNNLLLWTKMPDDRESNFAGTGWASQGAYPTVRRYNFGANIVF